MSYEDFTTYTETDPNSRITKTSSKVTWTALTSGEKAWVAKFMGNDYFNGDFIHQFECEFSDPVWPAPSIFWTVADGPGFRDRANSSLNWYISFAWDDTILGAGFHLKCHRWADGPTDYDVWEGAVASTRYYVTIQHDWDGGVNGTGRTTAWIRTGSHSGTLRATLSVDRGVGGQLAMDYIYACQTQDDEDEGYVSGFTENLDLTPPIYKDLAGVITISSTVPNSKLTRVQPLAGTSVVLATVVASTLGRTRALVGTIEAAVTVPDTMLGRTKRVSRTTSGETVVTGEIELFGALAGTVEVQTEVTGALEVRKKLSGNIEITTVVTGDIVKFGAQQLTGVVSIESTVTATLTNIKWLSGTVNIQSTVISDLEKHVWLAGTVEIQSATSVAMKLTSKLVGVVEIQSSVPDTTFKRTRLLTVQPIEIQSTVEGSLLIFGVQLIAGSCDIQSTCIGDLVIPAGERELAGVIAIQSTCTCTFTAVYDEIPAAIRADLIKPYSGGAWLWLAEIVIPEQTTQRIARNTEDIKHAGKTYKGWNFTPGKQTFAGDGRIPRFSLQVAQDPDGVLEGIVNASRGAKNGVIKLLRVNEKFLNYEVAALEATYNILVAASDWEWIYFTLGMPNLLTQKFPLRLGSSKVCPWALPELFKGPKCRYVGEDVSCTGSIEDCRDDKENAEHWGGALGLDPSVARV